MPEYLAPGTYVEELRAATPPIQGVGTSTTGMVGRTERGPDTPILVTSWPEFQRWYGDYVDPAVSYLPFSVAGFFANGGRQLFVAKVAGTGAEPAALLAGTASADQKLVATAIGVGDWGNRVRVRIAESRKGIAGRFRIQVLYHTTPPPEPFVDPFDPAKRSLPDRVEPTVAEEFDDLGVDPLGARYAQTVVNAASHLIRLDWSAAEQPPAAPELGTEWALLTGGSAGADLAAADVIGVASVDPGARRGLAGLEAIDEIAILAVPDAVNRQALRGAPPPPNDPAPPADGPAAPPDDPAAPPDDPAAPPDDAAATSGSHELENAAIVGALLDQCERLRDRFAILDVGPGEADVATIPGRFLDRRSDFAAIYYPFVRMPGLRGRPTALVPPSGFVAGIYALNDATRGVHKAPANYELRGILSRDVSPTEGPLEFQITKEQQGFLNPQGVNVIRDLRASRQGVRVWGARTTTADPEWTYVNVRRLFLFVEESVDEALQWVVFEPNDEPTWARVRRGISAFLERVWRDGALQGETAEQAFFVRCDRTTMSTDDILNGRLICLVGMAAVRPAEFVIFRFTQLTIESTS